MTLPQGYLGNRNTYQIGKTGDQLFMNLTS